MNGKSFNVFIECSGFDGQADLEVARILKELSARALKGLPVDGMSRIIQDKEGVEIGHWHYS